MTIRMPLPPQPSRGALPSPGTHLAALWSIVLCGSQSTEWDGERFVRPQVQWRFETIDELMEDGRPFDLSRIYTLSWHERALFRAHLVAWHGRELTPAEYGKFDMASLIGKVAAVGVTHAAGRNGTVYANISSVSRPPAGVLTQHQLVNRPVLLSPDAFDAGVYRSLPPWMQRKLADAVEYQAAFRGGEVAPAALADRLRAKLAGPTASQVKSMPDDDTDLNDSIPF